ncbi:uncharacterized protein A1O5_10622 [Cladophialophora psammophila CBS 110553]|uniref:Enoyl reductase (ER) domain-containing protein n=1 Tax=Cladophialophora psammophila CBS 110553 TaxID=1182543 RepID=W9WN84_9EURO|nr:uncharacterized protein A1O5_10622 [Cladophialophora psammophila CBS 110553]EXJ66470.1 hypothetical protein A1O5_10622 [Cladophialophora psammophila CBS 110553]
MVTSKTLIFAHVPQGIPVAGKDVTVEARPVDTDATPPTGGFVARVLYASFDPYLRHRLVDAAGARDFPPFELGASIVNGVVVEVLRSGEDSGLSKDDVLVGMGPIAHYAIIGPQDAVTFQKVQNPFNLDLKLFLGPLGMPGLTAYSAFYEIARPKKGEKIFISAASGAVGQIVGQLAKREGLTAIGSVGSDAKLTILKEKLGFDEGFNYKKVDVLKELKRLAPNGIDIYYDNVGGKQLEAAITALKDFGRIVACGYASQYSVPHDKQYGVRNTGLVVGKRITWRGFTVFDDGFGNKYAAEHQQNVQKWIHDGSIRPLMSVTRGMDRAPEGLVGLFRGENIGKAVLDVWAKDA